MELAVDASTLVGELSRARGQRLISDSRLALAISAHVWSETQHELPRRLAARVRRGSLTPDGAAKVHADCLLLVARCISIVPESSYSHLEEVARRRVPRDPNDWPTVALALTLECDIWTADADFLGCGVATWTTETLQLHPNA
jgi:predicted nucleic acid-binding protein